MDEPAEQTVAKRQKTLSSWITGKQKNSKIDENNNETQSTTTSNQNSKKRKYLPEWEDHFTWLWFEDKMYCTFCEKSNKTNPFTIGCSNFQKSTSMRHQISKDHKESIQRLQLQSDLKRSVERVSKLETEKYDSQLENYLPQLRTVYVMAKNNLPGDAFGSLMQLQQINGVQVTNVYAKPEIVSEMETAVTAVIEETLWADIKSSKYVGIMLDETCDISIEKKLVIYVRYLKNEKVHVAFVGNHKVTDCTAEGIKTSLMSFLETKGLGSEDDLTKVMGLGTDEASVMVGCRNGLGMKLKAYNPMLIQVHCVAHRLNLAASQASKGIQYLEDFKAYIHTLYRFYADSSVRYDKLRELQQLLHGKVKQVPEGTSVRWLSIEAAVKMIYKYYDSIIMSLENDADKTGKAAGIYKFVGTALFILAAALLIDILTVICILSLTFQKDHVNLASIRHNVNSTLETLEAMKIRSNTVDETLQALGQVPVVGDKNEFKGVRITDNNNIRQRFSAVRANFLDNLKQNIRDRFPENQIDLVDALDAVYNPKRYPDQGRNLHDYATEQLELLLQHYSQIVDQNRMRNQYLTFKYLAMSYKNTLDFLQFTELLLHDHENTYPDFVKLAQIALIIPVSSAPCERGFSHQNALKNKTRNRLNPERLNRLIMIKLQGPEVTDLDFLSVARKFRQMKKRLK